MINEVTEQEVGSDLQRPPRSEQELKQVAMDLVDGKIFSDRHFREGEAGNMIQLVFRPLALMDEQRMPLFMAEQPDFLYEYYDQAGPRSVNGYPIFFSMQFLRKDETTIMLRYYERLIKMKKEFMGDDNEKSE